MNLLGIYVRSDSKPSVFVHGIYHVEKVFLYTYIMIKAYNSKNVDKISDEHAKLLYYAALYHDIGRVDNSEDIYHGYNSSKVFYQYFKDNEFFKENPFRMHVVEILCHYHSQKDGKLFNISAGDIFQDHYDLLGDAPKGFFDYISQDKFELLAKIIKDADGLDRKRFGEGYKESLNIKYLRTEESLNLVDFADEINKLYYVLSRKNYYNVDTSRYEQHDFFHSIGFDFFKVRSILKNGILSQIELEEIDIDVPRNFDGGNCDRWISVVDASLYEMYIKFKNGDRSMFIKNEKVSLSNFASHEFTKQGITFYCSPMPLMTALSSNRRYEALETGMPWDKSHYFDERYILNKVPRENILAVIIPKKHINSKVINLKYLFQSLDVELIKERIMYYARCLHKNLSIDELDDVSRCIKELKVLNEQRIDGILTSNEYLENSRYVMDKLNSLLAHWVNDYYCIMLGKDRKDGVTVSEVLHFELEFVNDLEHELITSEDSDDISTDRVMTIKYLKNKN